MPKFDLPLVTAVSSAMLALTGCGDSLRVDRPTQICVGEQDRRVPDTYCEPANNGGGHFYRWYYYSRGGLLPQMGDPARGGGLYPVSGGVYSRAPSPAVTRGGFGSSSEGGGAGG